MTRILSLKGTTICAAYMAILLSASVRVNAAESMISKPSIGIAASLEQFYETENGTEKPLQSDQQEISENSIAAIAVSSAIQTKEETAAQKEKEAELKKKYKNTGIAQVNEYLNIRKSPKVDSEIVGKLKNNSGCEIQKTTDDGWAKITSGEVTGYVKTEFLLTGDKVIEIAETLGKQVVEIDTAILNVREEPSKEASILTLVDEGDSYPVYKIKKDWIQIGVNSQKGWVKEEFVNISRQLKTAEPVVQEEKTADTNTNSTSVSAYDGGFSTGQKIASYATQFIGNPYVWGGTSLTNGADCSGFVLSVFSHFGYSLNRNSAAQASNGTRIPVSDVRPGDLLFYGSGSIDHVGIYIGNGQIVHASNARTDIKISNSNYRTPICATRIVQ